MKYIKISKLAMLFVILLTQTSCLTVVVRKLTTQNYKIERVNKSEITKDSILLIAYDFQRKIFPDKRVFSQIDLKKVLATQQEEPVYYPDELELIAGQHYFTIFSTLDSTVAIQLYPAEIKSYTLNRIKNTNSNWVEKINTNELLVHFQSTRYVLNVPTKYNEFDTLSYKHFIPVNKLLIQLPKRSIPAYKLLYLISVPLDIATSPIVLLGIGVRFVIYMVGSKKGFLHKKNNNLQEKHPAEKEIIKKE